MITHTIWTTQEDTVFISDRDRNGGRCSVGRADVSRDSLIVSEKPERILSGFSLTMRESLETSALPTEHRPPFLSLSLIKTVSSCVVQIVCVITNQGSGNPNCFEFSGLFPVSLFLSFFWDWEVSVSFFCLTSLFVCARARAFLFCSGWLLDFPAPFSLLSICHPLRKIHKHDECWLQGDFFVTCRSTV